MIYDWLKPQWDQLLSAADRMPHALLLAGPLWMTRERWRGLLRDAPTGALLLVVALGFIRK